MTAIVKPLLAPSDTPDTTYQHNQITPSAVWIITHAMSGFPSVTTADSAGTVVIGEIEYDSASQVTITFSSAFAGTAYLNI